VIINLELFMKVIEYNSYMSIKLSILILLFMYMEDIISFTQDVFVWKIESYCSSFRIKKDFNEQIEDEMEIYTIPISKLIEFLFKYNGFNNKKFLDEIICDNNKFKKIWDLLEKKEILIRGKNNARVLNTDIWIEEVIELLTKPTICKESDIYYSYNPAIT